MGRHVFFAKAGSSCYGAAMNKRMGLDDYFDLEWFVEQDRLADPVAIRDRDRRIGLDAQHRNLPPEQFVTFWLSRRRAETDQALPSLCLGMARRVLGWILLLAGLACGVSLSRALLLYSGTAPVNVSVFLLAAVAFQAGMCLLAALFMLLRLGRGQGRLPWMWLFDLAWKYPPVRRSLAAGFVRSIVTEGRRLAGMLAWDFLRLVHLGGLGLALGTLVGTLASVAVTDLAFGWQSTLRVGPQGMQTMVTGLALPWSWLPDSLGLIPDLQQIEGSRIVLKDGIATLTTAALTAWWPFLAMCLLTYAVVPRIVLLAAAHLRLCFLVGAFVHPDAGRIQSRMAAPMIAVPRDAEPDFAPLPLLAPAADAEDRCPHQPERLQEAGCALIIPPELQGRIAEQDLRRLAERACGYPLTMRHCAGLDVEQVQKVLDLDQSHVWQNGVERYVVLVEAWQPPIRETLNALAVLGRAEGGRRDVTLLLTGRPAGGSWLTAVPPSERQAWDLAVERLALPVAVMEVLS